MNKRKHADMLRETGRDTWRWVAWGYVKNIIDGADKPAEKVKNIRAVIEALEDLEDDTIRSSQSAG